VEYAGHTNQVQGVAALLRQARCGACRPTLEGYNPVGNGGVPRAMSSRVRRQNDYGCCQETVFAGYHRVCYNCNNPKNPKANSLPFRLVPARPLPLFRFVSRAPSPCFAAVTMSSNYATPPAIGENAGTMGLLQGSLHVATLAGIPIRLHNLFPIFIVVSHLMLFCGGAETRGCPLPACVLRPRLSHAVQV
jgi:hypothetical protein